MILLLFFLLVAHASVVPLFSCWFSAPESGATQLVLGYNNSASASELIYTSGRTDDDTRGAWNTLLPGHLAPVQIQLFQPGYVPFAMVLGGETISSASGRHTTQCHTLCAE